jgi:hypothetical protein
VRYLLRYSLQVLKFVPSKDMDSDVCTKNITEATHTKFLPLFINGLIGKFMSEIANRDVVNDRALAKDDIIQGARAWISESCFQSRKRS